MIQILSGIYNGREKQKWSAYLFVSIDMGDIYYTGSMSASP